jgi:hypothetical protein
MRSARSVVETHNGMSGLTSEGARGTTVEIRIPRERGEQMSRPLPDRAPPLYRLA